MKSKVKSLSIIIQKKSEDDDDNSAAKDYGFCLSHISIIFIDVLFRLE